MDEIGRRLHELAQEEKAWLVRVRRDLHRHPEPAWAEYRTAALCAQTLEECGLAVRLGRDALLPQARPRRPDPRTVRREQARAAAQGAAARWLERMPDGLTGLWGDLELAGPPAGEPADDEPGPLIVFRFDMDANAGICECREPDHAPAAEGFASCRDDAMHACGHDGHVAIGLGLARLLAALRPELETRFRGRIRLVFQPAEEEGEGAPGMVAAGAVDGASRLFGLHLSMQAGVSGSLVCGTTHFLATTNFEVFFDGRAAHAGLAPQEGRNALLAACTACTALLGIARHGEGASRINVGEMRGGEAPNAIPAHAWFRGETRGETSDINGFMMAEARRMVQGAARMHGCTARLLCQSYCPGASSHPELTALVERVAEEMGGFTHIMPRAEFRASEDCCWFMNKVEEDGGQAVYLQLGADRPSGHHTPRFTFDENVLPRGVELLARLALATLARRDG